MSKGKRKRKRPGHHGSRPAMPSAEALLAELASQAEAIAASDPESAGPLWGAAHRLLLKSHADPEEAARLVTTRDAEGLARVVRVLRGEEAPADEPGPGATDDAKDGLAAPAAEVSPETMKKAMRAFRRRLKLMRLDEESKLGVGPMTGGKKSDIDAIIPPFEYPREVWEALSDAGQLRRVGPGFYMLAEQP